MSAEIALDLPRRELLQVRPRSAEPAAPDCLDLDGCHLATKLSTGLGATVVRLNGGRGVLALVGADPVGLRIQPPLLK